MILFQFYFRIPEEISSILIPACTLILVDVGTFEKVEKFLDDYSTLLPKHGELYPRITFHTDYIFLDKKYIFFIEPLHDGFSKDLAKRLWRHTFFQKVCNINQSPYPIPPY